MEQLKEKVKEYVMSELALTSDEYDTYIRVIQPTGVLHELGLDLIGALSFLYRHGYGRVFGQLLKEAITLRDDWFSLKYEGHPYSNYQERKFELEKRERKLLLTVKQEFKKARHIFHVMHQYVFIFDTRVHESLDYLETLF